MIIVQISTQPSTNFLVYVIILNYIGSIWINVMVKVNSDSISLRRMDHMRVEVT
jgi:hypothetical protein